jgi:hypothetical protein
MMLSVPFASISFAAGLTGGNAETGSRVRFRAVPSCSAAERAERHGRRSRLHNKAQPAAIDARRRLAVEIWADPGRGEICMEATLPSRGPVCLIRMSLEG